MKQHLRTFMESKLRRDLQRLVPLFAIAGLILIPDSGFSVVVFVLGALIFTAGVSHLIRKILFPYLDLERLLNKAEETPLSAAIVFIGMMYILGEFIRFASTLMGH